MSTITAEPGDSQSVSRRKLGRMAGLSARQVDNAADAGLMPSRLTLADLEWIKTAARLAQVAGIGYVNALRAVRAGWRPPAEENNKI